VGPRNGLDGLEKRKNLLLLPGFELETVQPIAYVYIDYARGLVCL